MSLPRKLRKEIGNNSKINLHPYASLEQAIFEWSGHVVLLQKIKNNFMQKLFFIKKGYSYRYVSLLKFTKILSLCSDSRTDLLAIQLGLKGLCVPSSKSLSDFGYQIW